MAHGSCRTTAGIEPSNHAILSTPDQQQNVAPIATHQMQATALVERQDLEQRHAVPAQRGARRQSTQASESGGK
jgi:hypothetical protein